MSPLDEMYVYVTGKQKSERSRCDRAIKFPLKLMYILECGKYTDAIQWAQEGSSFTVINRDNFERSVLPDLFKDTLFESFQRKLYRWNFGKDGCVVTMENAPGEQKDDKQKDEKKEEDNEKERKEDISIAEGKSGAAEAAITAIPVKRPAPPTVPRRPGGVSFSHSQFRAGDWDLCRSIKCRKRILSKRDMEKKQVRTEARNQKRKAKQEKKKALHQLRRKRTKKAGGMGDEKKASASHSLPPITSIPPSLPAPSTSTSPSLPPNTSTSCNQKEEKGCTSTLVYSTHPAAGNDGVEVTSNKKHVTGFFPPHLPPHLSPAFDQNDASLSNQDFYQHMPEEVIPYHSAEEPGDRRDRRPGGRDVPPTEKINGSNTVSSENNAIAANPPPSNTDDCLDSELQQSRDDDTRMEISLTSDEPRSVSWSASSDASSSNANFSTTVVDAASHRTGSPASEGEVEQKTWLSPTTTDTKSASELKAETAQLAEISRLREENLLLFFSILEHRRFHESMGFILGEEDLNDYLQKSPQNEASHPATRI